MLWTGCYEVRLTPQSELYEEGAYGAFVNVWANCKSEAAFREMAAQALLDENYEILDVSDVALDEDGPVDDIAEMIDEQLREGSSVAFGPFHCYPKDGLDA